MEDKDKQITLDDITRISLKRTIKHRLPWLFVGMVGGILASAIVSNFEKTLEQNLILASFIPLIVYMSDAVGTQMESFVIRDMAIHKNLNYIKYLIKQFISTTFIAIVLGTLLFAYSILFHKNPRLSFVLSFSMFISIISSVITGIILPMIFRRERLDPANASGPIATIVQDILSVTIYFIVASILL